jgi:hypothetical protein
MISTQFFEQIHGHNYLNNNFQEIASKLKLLTQLMFLKITSHEPLGFLEEVT